MSEKAVPQPEPTEEDVNTTPPNPQPANGKSGWTMPEPVFRRTSGYLPQGFEKRFAQDELKAADDKDTTAEMPAPDLDAVIEPQPDIGEPADDPLSAEHAQAPAAVPAKRPGAAVGFGTDRGAYRGRLSFLPDAEFRRYVLKGKFPYGITSQSTALFSAYA